MTRSYRALAACALAATAVPFSGAHAQYYGTTSQAPPLYPYAVQPGQPYAVEVAPGTYVIKRPAAKSSAAREETRRPLARASTRNDPRVVAELRQRHASKQKSNVEVINTRKVVRHKPVVIETTKVVDDPPKVIVRKRYVDDTPTASIPTRRQTSAAPDLTPREDGKKRVIEADAEVTILGPDRMSIQLFRKGQRSQAKASAAE